MDMTIDQVNKQIETSVTQAVAKAFDPKAIGEALAFQLKEALKAGVAKPLVDTHGEEKFEKAMKGGAWYKALLSVACGKAVGDEVLKIGADAQGGYTVPTEVATEIAKLEPAFSVARKYCRVMPQKASTVNLPLRTSAISVSYPGEVASGSDTEPVFSVRQFTLKRGIAIIPVTLDLLESSAVDIFNYLNEEFAEAFGNDLDSKCFTDQNSVGIGVLYGAGKSETLLPGKVITDVTVQNLLNMLGALQTTATAGGMWVMSPSVFGVVSGLSDGTGRPIYLGPGLGVPGSLLNYGYALCDQMPSKTAASSANTAALFFGNLRKYRIGEALDMEIAVSKEATVDLSAGSISAFSYALAVFRGMCRRSMNLEVPDAFVKLETGA